MAALLCILAPLAVPIGPVPVTLATFLVYLAVYVLGTKLGTISCLIYLMLGFAGLPVFSGYSGGAARLFGPTGGYLAGYIFLALVSGVIMEKTAYHRMGCFAGMIAGTAVLYAFGTGWYMIMSKSTLQAALAACVLPFLIGDLVKIVFAELLGREVRSRIKMAGFL